MWYGDVVVQMTLSADDLFNVNIAPPSGKRQVQVNNWRNGYIAIKRNLVARITYKEIARRLRPVSANVMI